MEFLFPYFSLNKPPTCCLPSTHLSTSFFIVQCHLCFFNNFPSFSPTLSITFTNVVARSIWKVSFHLIQYDNKNSVRGTTRWVLIIQIRQKIFFLFMKVNDLLPIPRRQRICCRQLLATGRNGWKEAYLNKGQLLFKETF